MIYSKEEIKKLLEKAYELEGLLLLALHREEPPLELGILISQKCEEISTGAVDALSYSPTNTEPEPDESIDHRIEDFEPTESLEGENPEETVETGETEIPEEKAESEEPAETIEAEEAGFSEEEEIDSDEEKEPENSEEEEFLENQDEIEESEEPEENEEEDGEVIEDEEDNDYREFDEDENEDIDGVDDEGEDMDEEEDEFDDGTFYTLEEEEPYQPKNKPDRSTDPVTARVAPKFSINDKFLFIREIFKGNASEFNEAIEKMRTLPNAQQAEEYYIENLKLDPDDPAAAHFLETVRTYFKQQVNP